MKMFIQMHLICQRCGKGVDRLVEAGFWYSDGCYTVLKIAEPKCEQYSCAHEAAREKGVRVEQKP